MHVTLQLHDRTRIEPLRYASRVLLASAGFDVVVEARDALSEGEAGLVLPDGACVPQCELQAVFDAITLAHEQTIAADAKANSHNESAVRQDVSVPWIDLRGRDLANLVARKDGAPEATDGRRGRFRVIISHDVDWTTCCEPFSLAKSCLCAMRLLRRPWFRAVAALSPSSLVRNIEQLLEWEMAHGIRGYYFMLSGPYSLRRHGTRYDIRWPSARGIARLIQQAGMVVGLHGSYHAGKRDSYAAEKQRLEDVLGAPVNSHRNHYLRFDRRKLWSQLEAAGIRYDFSVGFNRQIGFRAGVGRVCRGFDQIAGRTSVVRFVPLLLMDTARPIEDRAATLAELRRCLEYVKTIGGCVSVLFHPEAFLIDSRYRLLFEETIALCRELEADLSGMLPDEGAD